MNDSIGIKIQGLDAALAKMRGLTPQLRAKGARTAMRKAANLVRDAAVANASRIDDPETSENIARNIAVKFSSRALKRNGDVMFRVGVLGGARQYGQTRQNVRKGRVGKTYGTLGDKSNPGGDTWYWRLVELGTSRSRAQPFLRPALADNVETATATAARELERAIDRIAKKAGP